jgi:hypothetical protein
MLKIMTAGFMVSCSALLFAAPPTDGNFLEDLDKCNVVWDSPSNSQDGTMPIGNGEVGLNVWAENDGDICFYISRTDAWGDNARPLKLGRVRLHMDPNPFEGGRPFKQELCLRDGVILVTAGGEADKVRLKVWVDANRDVIHVDGESMKPLRVTAAVELWRKTKRPILEAEKATVRGTWRYAKDGVTVEPDTLLPTAGNSIRWCHRNVKSPYTFNMKVQRMDEFIPKYPDPIINLTFGAIMSGKNFKPADGKDKLESVGKLKKFGLTIDTLTEQTDTLKKWEADLEKLWKANREVPESSAWKDHRKWWNAFWQRSWVLTDGGEDEGFVVKMYNLQRWVTACQGRGAYPIKFNGGIFTVGRGDGEFSNKNSWDPDYRRWGGGFWFQNTRFPYWAMLASGDYDMLRPLMQMYKNAIPLLKERTKKYFGHGGVYFGETIFFWGLYTTSDFKYGENACYSSCGYIRYYFQSGLEFSCMMLDAYLQNRDAKFLKRDVLPIADEILRFYREHYKNDECGKLRIAPAQSVETYRWDVENPLPVLSGLHALLKRLIALPESLTTAQERASWKDMYAVLPPLPKKTEAGKTFYLPAEKFNPRRGNVENPSLYAVFPYRICAIGQPDLEVGRATWPRRVVKRMGCWHQDLVESAMLGLTKDAQPGVVQMAHMKDGVSRFPAFWGAGHDWLPDQDHGGNLMVGLQRMLMQWDDNGKIYVLPTWPKEWPVKFRLHAIDKTMVDVEYRDGKINCTVTPESKKKDVVFPEWARK